MEKKVLVFMNYYGKSSETFIADELQFLFTKSEISLEILHYGKSNDRISGLDMPTSTLKRFVQNPAKFSLYYFKSLKFKNGLNGSLGYLINFFRERKFDTIYCHFGTNGKLIAQLKAIGVIPKTTKLIIRFHGLDMNFEKYNIGFYKILRTHADIVLYGTQMAKSKLSKYGLTRQLVKLPVGISRNNIVSIKNLSNYGICIGDFKVLSVGRFIELKGHRLAVDILSKLNDDNVKFEIIGDGPLFSEIANYIKLKKIDKKINLLGMKNHHEVISELQNSITYLYSGVYDSEGRCENQATSVLEAMAQGKIVLSSALGGIPDYLIDNVNGFLCEPGNVNQFVDKLRWIVQNYTSNEMLEIRKNAIITVQSSYCQENLNEKLLKLLIE
ncbi:glycosyltransferase [Epilithonimonas xixisoli]|uniref:Glycosyltransferase involved in cell wall biosynthesis n=1 Tax=Epilithonimonas xixisoli TaxID=1476462 RepID=A0A4R8I6S4_9FLAO|nr:glycosyltransferase [Epilithonimonas xixisoli]TDX84095.1 glycosyltransferase involved in cell wall biosynthesis [Epilithonimonas xixisoli]